MKSYRRPQSGSADLAGFFSSSTADSSKPRGRRHALQYLGRVRARVEQLTTRQAELEAQNAQLRQQLGLAQRELSLRSKKDAPLPPAERQSDSVKEVPVTFHLREKTVLCVGGRNGNVASYRTVIEKAGGHFAHHDGGLEDNQAALDSVLAAADLVICQTGCISHNAYWRVKDFCKRMGKQCVFVENPSTSSLARSLQQIAVDDTAVKTTENAPAP